jgi:hypothetical protein
MNKELDNTVLGAGDSISANADRGALDRRAPILPTDATVASDGRPIELPTPDEDARPASRSRRLRRWSVAELIARAGARPPAGRVAH